MWLVLHRQRVLTLLDQVELARAHGHDVEFLDREAMQERVASPTYEAGVVQRSGEASGVQSTSRQIGSALGIAILGTVLFTITGSQLQSKLADSGLPPTAQTQIVDAVVESAGGAIPGLATNPATAAVAPIAEQAFSDATRAAAFTASGFLVLGLLASLSLGERKEKRRGRHEAGAHALHAGSDGSNDRGATADAADAADAAARP